MKDDSKTHCRRSIRLKHYDYSQAGLYFITICTYNREKLFGEINDGEMICNINGQVAYRCWSDIPNHYPDIELDVFIIMPNHLHGILIIYNKTNTVGVQNFEPLQQNKHQCNRYQKIIPCSIGSVIRGFKIGVTKWFRKHNNKLTIWQRNFYEHIIRNCNELNCIREYIVNNPQQWQFDRENPCRFVNNIRTWHNIEEKIYGKSKKQ